MPFTPPFRPVGPVRPTRGRAAGAGGAAAFALALLLGGCAGAPTPSPSPTPSASEAAPIFASDEEALAAAEAAYKAFEEASQAIAGDGGASSERIDALVTKRYAPQLHEEFDQYRELGLHTTGSSSIDTVRLAEYTDTDSTVQVSIYLCRDVSNVRVLDSSGSDVTPTMRDDRTPLTSTLISSSPGADLLVDEVELWPGEDFC